VSEHLPVYSPRRCDAISPKTRRKCRNVARTGSHLCAACQARAHLANPPPVFPARGPGRPPTHGGYSRYLDVEEREVYNEHFGDFSLVHELALSKTLFTMLLRMFRDQKTATIPLPDGGELVLDAEEVEAIAAAAGESGGEPDGRRRRRPPQITIDDLLRSVERIVKIATAAQEQVYGKKITVQFADAGVTEEVRTQTETWMRELLSWMKECLCRDCRIRLAEELRSRRVSEVTEE
jgi:hypothetical protein